MPDAAPPDLTSTEGGSTGTGDQQGTNLEPDQQTQQQTSTETEPKATETVDYWKQRSRENERKAKDNAAAAKKLGEIEDKDKTEQQRLTEQLAQAEREKVQAETALLRAEVASAKGLSASMAGRLVGDTKDEIEADADALLAELKTAGASPPADLKQGARGTNTGTNDVDAWIRQQAGRS